MHKAAAVSLIMFSRMQRVRTQSWRSTSSTLAVTIVGLLARSPCVAIIVVEIVVVFLSAAAAAAVSVVVVVVVVVEASFAFETIRALPLIVSSLTSL